MPDDPGVRAFLYSPLVLASRLDTSRLPDSLIVGFQAPDLKKEPAPGMPALPAHAADVSRWNRISGDGLDFEVPNAGRKVVFTAFNSIGPGERYSIYWKVS